MTRWEIIHRDCLAEMRAMAPDTVDAIVTDPPYGLEFMGKEWDKLGRLDAYADSAQIPQRDPTSPAGRASTTYGSRVNRRCLRCGHYRFSGTPCKCGPDAQWDILPGMAMQEWHYAWAVEALRVAKPGAHLVAFGGTRTHHRLMCALEDAGWDVRDCLMWVYGSGFPKSLDVSKAIDEAAGVEREVVGEGPFSARRPRTTNYRDTGCANVFGDDSYERPSGDARTAPATDAAKQWDGWGTALKPAWEPIILARKPLTGTVAANVLEHGTGALNVEGCRIGTTKNVPASPSQTDSAIYGDGISLTSEDAPSLPVQKVMGDIESGQRQVLKPNIIHESRAAGKEREHNAAKPLKVITQLIINSTDRGEVIVDPFLGSGTTLIAAEQTGRICYSMRSIRATASPANATPTS